MFSIFPYRAVHRAFFTSDNVHIASFSDDKSVILWDISTEEQVVSFKEHSVSIRSLRKCKDFETLPLNLVRSHCRIIFELVAYLPQIRTSSCPADTTAILKCTTFVINPSFALWITAPRSRARYFYHREAFSLQQVSNRFAAENQLHF